MTSSNTLHAKDSNGLEFPISGSDDFKALPDHPIQLVRPDPNHHKKLEVIEKNMRHLHYITNGVAVVAVVGKFHSGKSFLLNQLMGKYDGFGIGPTVRPHTMGIWMWGKVSLVICVCTCSCMITCIYIQPVIFNSSDGTPTSVIYLDTEGLSQLYHCLISLSLSLSLGFAASNISEVYDAKIFAVATILSSYLIYNSVKVRIIINKYTQFI